MTLKCYLNLATQGKFVVRILLEIVMNFKFIIGIEMPAEEEYQIPSQNCTRKHFLRESSREEICFANICQTVSNLFKELRSFPIC